MLATEQMIAPDTASSASVRRDRIATGDVDEATEIMAARYADHAPSFSGSRDGFRFRVVSDAVSTTGGAVSVDRLQHSMAVSALVEPPRSITLVVPSSGRLRFSCRGEVAESGPRLCPSWAPFRSDWEDVDITVGSIDADGVGRIGAEVSGLDPSAVAFTGMTPTSPDHARYIASVLGHLGRDLLTNDEAMTSPLARGQAFRQLATALLLVFPNTTHSADQRADTAGPATLRRAVEYIDGHAAEDIGLTEIARVARISPRGLQLTFRKHLDCTPLAYLRRARMDRAHHDLQEADPTRGATVAAIAAHWGFTNAGRFSVEYRAAYGRSPRETLRQ